MRRFASLGVALALAIGTLVPVAHAQTGKTLVMGFSQEPDTFVAWVKHHNQAKVISEFRSSDGPGSDNGFAVYNAVQCTDAAQPRDWPERC